MIKKIFNNVSALPEPIGNIVHVGAGQCSELTTYLSLNPQKIILIEADSEQVTRLKKSTRDQEKIDVLSYAVAGEKEQRTLNILTNPRDNSLLMPDKILEHYPSLAVEREQVVTTENLSYVLQDYPFNHNFHHLLILEVQGVEDLVIQAAIVKLVQVFSGIVVRVCDDNMYKKESQENIVDLLESIGFNYTHQENELYSSVFYKLYFQRSDEKIELADNKRQLEQINKDKQEQANLAIEQLQQIQVISEERDTLVKLAADRQSQIESVNKVKDEQVKLAADRQTQLAAVQVTKDEQVKLATDHQQKIQQLTQELEGAKQTASLSVKLQMLKEGDLRDLQERYKTAQITLENQNELLEKLSDRLGSAAQYFHLISQEEVSEKEKVISSSTAKLEKEGIASEEIKKEKPPRRGLARFFGFK